MSIDRDYTIVVLEGDQTGQELLEESLRVLEPFAGPLGVRFRRFDLSLENRRQTRNQVVYDAAEAVCQHGLGRKRRRSRPVTRTMWAARTRFCVRPSARR